ncbi:MAG: RpiB/LacA/LacB family sugar-phosphate isomerase, partial [Chlamydiia bacterium]|nr:RpiB/LacA/LacB family sugar-phosphate isomerase [Chlamydiia bacterium]
MSKKVYIANDHAAVELKQFLMEMFSHIEWVNLGTNSFDSVDYPDFAKKLSLKLKEDPSATGVLICGSGQGMSIVANKFKHIRAALCWNEEVAQLAREHNDANVLCL